MYESFYRLRSKPFILLADGEFFYCGSTHGAAYSLLEYGLINEAPFMVLTGEPGMGKTSLLRKVIAENHDTFTIGIVTNARYDIEQVLPWILLAFGLGHQQVDPVEAYHTFSEFINRETKRNRRVVLIVDEAQSLASEQLEELRLLSNLNDGKTLKLQIILSGQPALRSLLQRIDMTQFAQRIVVDHHLEPFSEEETSKYVIHRLQKAGATQALFTNEACSLVYRLSRGIPRLINQLCDISLTYGFAEQTSCIGSKLVAQAALDRSRGGILPLGEMEELTALAARPHNPEERSVLILPAQGNTPEAQVPEPIVDPLAVCPVQYQRGVALRRERRFKEAIEFFDRANQSPSYCFKSWAQIGLCYTDMGEPHAAIAAFRTALRDQSASRHEVINVQYSLARTLELVGEVEEAALFYQRIIRVSPSFKDAAVRIKRLTAAWKPVKDGKRPADINGSWFSHVLDIISGAIAR